MIESDYTISKPIDNPTLRVLSLGAGVQSTVMALLAARGLITPMPDCAIFADTGWEPKAIYDHLDWLEDQLPFPIYIVRNGNIKDGFSPDAKGRFASIPFFIRKKDGSAGLGQRQCTYEYKIKPVVKKIRSLCGLKKGEKAKNIVVEQWMGISCDEIKRLSNPRQKWIKNRWPLLEIGFRRFHCQKWFAEHYPKRELNKSSCIGCPYHSNEHWREMRDNVTEEWEEAIRYDHIIRNGGTLSKGMKGEQFMHRSLKPLDQAPIDDGQDQIDFGFELECEGMCGT